ncbi:GlxA family transcriptional regulator [Conexibacter sp. SYSU D00693]|uniref:GlxA family transcriptional regulator n=1 Tax=Conexibacter sp. SYSU D00693 TaxID=2812560 RepID=UPI00196A5FF1|nr:helix-turn-helix domain-containing protein [Conexibacter sp. SYSU D00693]
MPPSPPPLRIRIVATPDSTATPLAGLYESLSTVEGLTAPEDRLRADRRPFDVAIVAEQAGILTTASGLAITAHESIDDAEEVDVVIVPSMAFGRDEEWTAGRYPRLVRWLREAYERGAVLCSACTGANLTAETGLLDGHHATVHWISERDFQRRHPDVVLRPDEVLVVSGDGGRLITSGAATAWHDLALHLVATYVGPATALAAARFLLIQFHQDGQTPFQVFDPPSDHGDAAVLAAQRAIDDRYAIAAPVDEMVRASGLAPRTFARRFKAATGLTPIAYVQHIRVERAKRLLEASGEPIDDISWAVGYEDPAAFRRLFKRLTSLTPGAYRQRFRLPALGAAA